VRAAILDGETNQPLALRGFYDKPATLTVEEEPSSGSNIKMALNQLIHMGVAWR
jgi:hypothetical protein